MYGIVSLLDDEHSYLTQNLWAELDNKFGVRGVYQTPFPHFSYHVSEQYEWQVLEPIVERIARETAGFQVTCTGLGVFTGTRPVVYIPIVRSQELSELHRMLWYGVEGVGYGVADHYHPERWIPHITLAQYDIDKENLPALTRFLNEYELNWKITINNLSISFDTSSRQGLRRSFLFAKGQRDKEYATRFQTR